MEQHCDLPSRSASRQSGTITPRPRRCSERATPRWVLDDTMLVVIVGNWPQCRSLRQDPHLPPPVTVDDQPLVIAVHDRTPSICPIQGSSPRPRPDGQARIMVAPPCRPLKWDRNSDSRSCGPSCRYTGTELALPGRPRACRSVTSGQMYRSTGRWTAGPGTVQDPGVQLGFSAGTSQVVSCLGFRVREYEGSWIATGRCLAPGVTSTRASIGIDDRRG